VDLWICGMWNVEYSIRNCGNADPCDRWIDVDGMRLSRQAGLLLDGIHRWLDETDLTVGRDMCEMDGRQMRYGPWARARLST
jgi:hypothetical protein